MHSFLKSIGFKNCTKKKQLKTLFEKIIQDPDQMSLVQIDEDSNIAVLSKEVAPDMGISLCGEMDESGNFEMEYYYPYLFSNEMSSRAYCSIKKQGEKEAYAGTCDDYRIGITLIFYLTNFMEMKEYYSNNGVIPEVDEIYLSALAEEGRILMPVNKTEKQIEAAKSAFKKRSSLIEAAKSGDQDAMESLTLEEMNTFTRLNKQITNNDLYSIIDSYFMPYGVECDQYSLMGEIKECDLLTNSFTGEKVYRFLLECNDMNIRLAINQEDLLGIPAVGRRFKGKIWLQGNVLYK